MGELKVDVSKPDKWFIQFMSEEFRLEGASIPGMVREGGTEVYRMMNSSTETLQTRVAQHCCCYNRRSIIFVLKHCPVCLA